MILYVPGISAFWSPCDTICLGDRYYDLHKLCEHVHAIVYHTFWKFDIQFLRMVLAVTPYEYDRRLSGKIGRDVVSRRVKKMDSS